MLIARIALDDAALVLEKLRTDPQVPEWRILWVSVVTLLRAVGHILDKRDAERRTEIRQAVDEAWAKWKSDREAHAIFWEFIEDERNHVVKTYEFGTAPGQALTLGPDVTLLLSTDRRGGPRVERRPGKPLGLENICEMFDGPFKGRDAREAVAEAIDWWERELDLVVARAQALRREDNEESGS